MGKGWVRHLLLVCVWFHSTACVACTHCYYNWQPCCLCECVTSLVVFLVLGPHDCTCFILRASNSCSMLVLPGKWVCLCTTMHLY